MTLLSSLFTLDQAEQKRKELQATIELQQQVEIAFTLGRSSGSKSEAKIKSSSDKHLKSLVEMGASIADELTDKELFHLQGLTQPATTRQVEILKHFKMPRSLSGNKTMANYYIRKIFSDAENIKEWQKRPPTSRVMQGLLFMDGVLARGMTQREAQLKLKKTGVKDPARFLEWKQIEYLFLGVNDQVTRQQNATRKITWKRFYHYYDEVLSNGLSNDEVTVEMVLSLIVSQQRSNLVLPSASASDMGTLSASV